MLSKYIYAGIAVVGLALVVGAYFKGRADVNAAWALERTESANDALREKNRLEAQYRALEAMREAHTRDLEADYARRIADNDAGRDAFGAALVSRVRASEKRACDSRLSAAAGHPGSAEDPAGGGDIEFRGIDIEGVQRVRAVGLKLQETVRLCHEWATSVGR